jgi:hypothetical protein
MIAGVAELKPPPRQPLPRQPHRRRRHRPLPLRRLGQRLAHPAPRRHHPGAALRRPAPTGSKWRPTTCTNGALCLPRKRFGMSCVRIQCLAAHAGGLERGHHPGSYRPVRASLGQSDFGLPRLSSGSPANSSARSKNLPSSAGASSVSDQAAGVTGLLWIIDFPHANDLMCFAI